MTGWKQHFLAAIEALGSQRKLAEALNCSVSRISWLRTTADKIPGEDALTIERVTNGAVKAADLRPDLWP